MFSVFKYTRAVLFSGPIKTHKFMFFVARPPESEKKIYNFMSVTVF